MAKQRKARKIKVQKTTLTPGKVLHIAVPNSEPPVVVLSPDKRAVAVIPATVVTAIVPEHGETWWEFLFGKDDLSCRAPERGHSPQVAADGCFC